MYNYPQYPNQFQNTYQPYVPQVPSVIPTATQSTLTGHLVASPDEIKPNDIPMNGQAAYFPSQDGKVIYAKAWNTDGSIATVRYVAESAEETPAQPTLFDIANQLQNIEDLLNAKPKPAAKRSTRKAADDE